MTKSLTAALFGLGLLASSTALASEKTVTLTVQNMYCSACPVKSSLESQNRLRSRANLRPPSRSAVGGYAVSLKTEPIEEHKESGIILSLTGRGKRLNNRAAILRSRIA